MAEFEQTVMGRAKGHRHTGCFFKRYLIRDEPGGNGRHSPFFGMGAEGAQGGHPLSDLAIGDFLSYLANHAGGIISDNVGNRRHEASGPVEHVTSFNGDRLYIDDNIPGTAGSGPEHLRI